MVTCQQSPEDRWQQERSGTDRVTGPPTRTPSRRRKARHAAAVRSRPATTRAGCRSRPHRGRSARGLRPGRHRVVVGAREQVVAGVGRRVRMVREVHKGGRVRLATESAISRWRRGRHPMAGVTRWRELGPQRDPGVRQGCTAPPLLGFAVRPAAGPARQPAAQRWKTRSTLNRSEMRRPTNLPRRRDSRAESGSPRIAARRRRGGDQSARSGEVTSTTPGTNGQGDRLVARRRAGSAAGVPPGRSR